MSRLTSEGRQAALKTLRRIGYLAEETADDDSVTVEDPVQCQSGSLSWTEYRSVVLRSSFEVLQFISARS